MNNANEILIRCSGWGYLMTEAQGKSPGEKYADAVANVAKYKNEYSAMNPTTKTAQNKLAQIQKANNTILELESTKNDIHLSETCRKALIKIFANEKYQRYEELKNKYLDKGNFRENDAITLLSRVKKINFKKNTVRLKNKFLQGEPDLYLGETISMAEKTLDTKNAWSLLTFLDAQHSEVNPIYDWQGQGYMDLTGAKKHTVAYCLVNGTYQAISDEIRKLGWRMGVLDASIETDPEFIKKVKQIERNHIFDIDGFLKENPGFELKNDAEFDGQKYTWEFDIAMQDRIHLTTFDRDDDKIAAGKERIIKCREYMNKNLFKVQNLIAQ